MSENIKIAKTREEYTAMVPMKYGTKVTADIKRNTISICDKGSGVCWSCYGTEGAKELISMLQWAISLLLESE